MELLRRIVSRLSRLPGVRHLGSYFYERRFTAHTGRNIYRGVYDSFEAAARSAPRCKPIGYDNPSSAEIYVDRLQRILPSDYPVIYWLACLFSAGCRTVLDLGGNVGNSYYAYSRYLKYPDSVEWIVHDVPAVLRVARRLACDNEQAEALKFVDRCSDAGCVDILLSNGALQFLPVTLSGLMATLAGRPRHLLINRFPLHPSKDYFTLQSIGSAFCPYHVAAEPKFLDEVTSLGYELVDRWRVPELRCRIPFVPPGHSIDGYAGFHFKAVSHL